MRSSIAGVGLLSLFLAARPQESQIPYKGLYDLVRLLLRGGAEGVSKRVRLVEEGPRGARATLYFTAGPEREIYAVFELARDAKLLVHTVRFTDPAGHSTRPRVVEMEPIRDDGRGELVVTQLSTEAALWMADAAALTVELQGWDRTARFGIAKKKDLARISSFVTEVLASSGS